ncbi:MAG: DNA-binding response regulator [Gammaproteobacteria bacterium]|nr:MAG: DNA-binding response regulator [Gammaproteobacteria bacterium]
MINKIIIADDHPLFRSALKSGVTMEFQNSEIIEVDSCKSLQERVIKHSDCDLILLDLCMPGIHGFSGLIFLRTQYPDIPVVIVSGTEDVNIVRQAIDFGSAGYIPKSSSLLEIVAAIKMVIDGGLYLPENMVEDVKKAKPQKDEFAICLGNLTPKQFTVLSYMAEGMLNKQIAAEIKVSEATVKAHVTAILNKLNVSSRTQAVIALKGMDISDNAS